MSIFIIMKKISVGGITHIRGCLGCWDRDLSSRTWFIRFFYDVPQENAERIGRWKFEKGVEFNGNLDKYRIEHLFFNLSSYTDETDPFK